MASDSVTGKAGKVTVAGATLTFTKWTAKPKKEYAKSTDSSNYVPGTKQLWTSQLAGEQNLEATVEGNWSRANTPTNLISKLQSDDPVAAVLMIDQSTTFCSGNFDLTDLEVGVEVEGAKVVEFSCTLLSNG